MPMCAQVRARGHYLVDIIFLHSAQFPGYVVLNEACCYIFNRGIRVILQIQIQIFFNLADYREGTLILRPRQAIKMGIYGV